MAAMTVADALRRSAARSPGRVALIVDSESHTYATLLAGAERSARQILALGVGKGDRIGVLLPNSLAYMEVVLGAAVIGVAVVPMNVRFKASELRHLITDSGMVALLTIGGIPDVLDFTALLGEALPGLGGQSDHQHLSLAAAPSLRAIARIDSELAEATGPLPSPPDEADTLLLMYTSGTTANPKGCIISNRALLSNCWAIIDRFQITAADSWWCPLPMFHIGGLLFPVTMLAAGGVFAGMAHFAPDSAIDMLRSDPPTIFYPLFPTITLAITGHARFGEVDFSGLRMLCNVGPEDVQRNIQAAFPHVPLVGAFGMTEASGTVAYGLLTDSAQSRLTSCGTPLPEWEIKIVDPNTRDPLGNGARGEIAIRGPALFDGYFNDPELTARQFTRHGFFLTGDVGSLDRGTLSFHGRFKDQLKVGGENVSALEVESFLARHPAVQMAQVVGVADTKYGEVPAAFIELKPGQTLGEAALLAFCEGQIARFKVPRFVRFVGSWPMSATKILKFRLKEQLEAELAAPSPIAINQTYGTNGA